MLLLKHPQCCLIQQCLTFECGRVTGEHHPPPGAGPQWGVGTEAQGHARACAAGEGRKEAPALGLSVRGRPPSALLPSSPGIPAMQPRWGGARLGGTFQAGETCGPRRASLPCHFNKSGLCCFAQKYLQALEGGIYSHRQGEAELLWAETPLSLCSAAWGVFQALPPTERLRSPQGQPVFGARGRLFGLGAYGARGCLSGDCRLRPKAQEGWGAPGKRRPQERGVPHRNPRPVLVSLLTQSLGANKAHLRVVR